MFAVNELLKATRGRLISGRKDIIIKGISIDSRIVRSQEAFIAIKGNNFDGHDFINEALKKGASCIIKELQAKNYEGRKTKNEGRRIAVMEVKDTIKALGDIARFQREKFAIPIIAITGSNGKTTTKEMIAWLLSKEFKVLKNIGTKNNQIGLPLTLLNLNSSYDVVVLEIGTNHFGEVGYLANICQPNIGVITNIGPAHLEYFKNLEGIFREKYTLLKHLKNPYIAILNADDAILKRPVIRKIRRPIVFWFGIKHRSDFSATDINILNEKIAFLVNPSANRNISYAKHTIGGGVKKKYRFTLKTLGYYNIHNALASITVARLFGMNYKDIASRLSTFEFPQSRLNLVRINNIRFIDDTYNSNPVSLRQALDSLDSFKTEGRKIFVMGDMLELGSLSESFHYQAGRQAAKVCDAFITVGELSKSAAEAVEASGFRLKNIFTCETLDEARDILFKKISLAPDDIVLVKGSRLMNMEEIFKK